MLKRAFLGGLLAAGIKVIDYSDIPSAVLRCNLSAHDAYTAGVYFRQQSDDPTSTVITFYNDEALRISSDVAKKVEKSFFKEVFRRVDYTNIGEIHSSDHDKEYQAYKEGIEALLPSLKDADCRIAVDMMHGIAADVFPDILNDLGVEHIMFNAHANEHRLANINALIKQSKQDMKAVIKAMKLDAGFMIHPYGQRLDIMTDNGKALGKQDALYAVLLLLDMEAKAAGHKKRVFLPTWAADIVYFENLEIERGQYANFKAEKMKKYDLVATGEGNFAFTEFATHRDSMFATLKILQMMLHHKIKLSEMIASLPSFYYKATKVECKQALKGKMMRMFLADAKGKESSTLDGVKIWLDKNDWILMIPDQYSDHLNLYIQAEKKEKGKAILAEYSARIEQWSKE
jgi:mannose-1-phosphate guanylyltransferase/phosphomannomutase